MILIILWFKILKPPFKKPKIIESGINIMQIFDVDTVVGLRPERDLLF